MFIVRAASGGGGFFCGGTLIHENYVLTGLFVYLLLSLQCCFQLFNDNKKLRKVFFHFAAAQCIPGPLTAQNQYVLDSVRLGDYDLNEACDKVRDGIY